MANSAAAVDLRSTAAILLFLLLLSISNASCQSYPFATFTDQDEPNFILGSNSSINSGALQITPDSLNKPELFLIHKDSRILLSHRFKLYDTPTKPNSTNHVASFYTFFRMNVFRANDTLAGEGLAFLNAPSTDDSPLNSDNATIDDLPSNQNIAVELDTVKQPKDPNANHVGQTNATLDGLPSNQFIAVELDTVKQPKDPNANHVGQTNATLDAQPSNQFNAVEFDTVKQSYVLNVNHVGLDINSIISNVTANLTDFGIEIAPLPTAVYSVWIDFSGVNRTITVYMDLTETKPNTPVLSASLDLMAHLNEFSYFGSSGSTGKNYDLNCILKWNLTVEYLPHGGRWPTWKFAAAIILPLVVAIIALALFGRYMMRRRVCDDPSMVEKLKSLPGMPREFTFKELKHATNNFDEKRKLGQGGFGVVYKGVIPGENVEVAVKKFWRERVSSQDDFLKELTIINRLRHKHLVPLLGWCHKKNMLLLVYELMPNGSLDKHIFTGDDHPKLSWDRRYNIIGGLASALHYLHDEYDQKVVHRDLKASNVMLDASFHARLGDFGLARAIDTDKSSYAELELAGVPGTLGYIAPECFLTGKATRQSDVFGFGAVMLEVACGRRPRCEVAGFQFLSDWVWKLYREGRILDAMDEKLAGEYEAGDAERLLMLALACSHPIPGERPKTQAIVQILSGTVPVPEVPPFKPALVWPSGPVEEEEEEEDSSTPTTRLTSSGVNSFFYASSGGWTPQALSREDVAGRRM